MSIQTVIFRSEVDDRIHMGDESACFSLTREMREVKVISRFTMEGEPVSKARARFTNQGSKTRTYTPAKTHAAEEKVAWLFRQATPGHQIEPEKLYGLSCVFFNGTQQRRDVDNMIKLICDGLNKVAWKDDVQVDEVSGRRGYDLAENARTEVVVYELGVRDHLTTPCQHCGVDIKTWPSQISTRKYCSPQCNGAAKTARRTCVCAHCLKEFQSPTAHRAKYCSAECKHEASTVTWDCVICGETVSMFKSWSRRAPICGAGDCGRTYWNEQRKAAAKGTCSDCGGPTSKKEYTRCRPCSFQVKKRATA